MTVMIAVVTGAGSGIGRALAKLCAQRGMRVVAADVDPEAVAATATEINKGQGNCRAYVLDVTESDAVERFAQQIFETEGRVDRLFNNAGVLTTGPVWQAEPGSARRAFEINMLGVLNGMCSFVPRLLSQAGPSHIINTGSVGALLSAPMTGVYTASKMAVRGLTETLYLELQSERPDIGVSLLCPGPVDTAMTRAARQDKHARAGIEAMERAAADGFAFISAEQCAEAALAGVDRGDFWIFTHPVFEAQCREQMGVIPVASDRALGSE